MTTDDHKHTWVLLQTLLNPDLITIKRHLTLIRKGTLTTKLSKYVWDLKRENVNYSIRWKILKRATTALEILYHI